jgi:hypothetical protein
MEVIIITFEIFLGYHGIYNFHMIQKKSYWWTAKSNIGHMLTATESR